MKYVVISAGLGLAAVAGYFVTVRNAPHAAKFYAVERETAVRPERFEAMKFPLVEVRSPASEGN